MRLLCCIFLLILCHGGSNNEGASIYHGKTNAWSNITLIQSNAPWTHFVYMIADNNLDYFGISDLEEMRLNDATTDELNLIVYIDRCRGCGWGDYQRYANNIYDCNTGESINGYFNGSKILQKANGNIWCQIYDFKHELDSMQHDNIVQFVGLMSQYQITSTYFMLNFWDHGGAWSGFGSDDHTAMSNTSTSINNLNKLFEAVQNGLLMTYIGRLDILGFDACIMTDYSVFHHISEYKITKYYIGSEVSEPGNGWDYYNGINASLLNPIKYSISIIDAYVAQGKISTQNDGAGYTLALFDTDNIDKFLNEFDSLIRMMSLGVGLYDYGMIMAILRGKLATITAEKDFYIYDLGLFLKGIINDNNLFWNTCNDRIKISGENVLNYFDNSRIYFAADFMRKDMSGSTIFYSTNYHKLNVFYYYNNDLISDNYIRLLLAMNHTLDYMKLYSDSTGFLSSSLCNTEIPNDLTFYISNYIKLSYSINYGLYMISTNVAPTITNPSTFILYPIDSNMSIIIALAELKTNVVDETYDITKLVTFWDGNIAFFINTIVSDNIYNFSDVMYATGDITFSSTNSISNIPYGYIVKYPLNIYDTIEEQMDNATQPNNGYIQFEIILGKHTSTYITISDLQLYEIDNGEISQISFKTNKIIEGLATVFVGNDAYNVATGTLMWPNFTISFFPFNGTWIYLYGSDVFGNYDYAAIYTQNVNISDWNLTTTIQPTINVETTTTTNLPTSSDQGTTSNQPTIYTTIHSTGSTTMMNVTQSIVSSSSTTESKTTENNDGSSNASKSGLDKVPGFAWLIIVVILILLVVVFLLLWLKGRKGSQTIAGNTQYMIQMTD